MKITKRQLRSIIKEEKAKLLKEYGAMEMEALSPLVAFAQAWAGLGDAIQEQMIDLSNAHIEGRLEDADFSPGAFRQAWERIQRPLRALASDDDTNAAELIDALEEAERQMQR